MNTERVCTHFSNSLLIISQCLQKWNLNKLIIVMRMHYKLIYITSYWLSILKLFCDFEMPIINDATFSTWKLLARKHQFQARHFKLNFIAFAGRITSSAVKTSCSDSSASETWKFRKIFDRIHFISNIAYFCPMQFL